MVDGRISTRIISCNEKKHLSKTELFQEHMKKIIVKTWNISFCKYFFLNLNLLVFTYRSKSASQTENMAVDFLQILTPSASCTLCRHRKLLKKHWWASWNLPWKFHEKSLRFFCTHRNGLATLVQKKHSLFHQGGKQSSWLVVSTHLQNISQIGSLLQVGKNKSICAAQRQHRLQLDLSTSFSGMLQLPMSTPFWHMHSWM